MQYLLPILAPLLLNLLKPSYGWPFGQWVFTKDFFQFLALPFFAVSFAFSAFVPRNKWSGLTQSGVSHLSKTQRLPGSPRKIEYENLCAKTVFPFTHR